MTLLPRYSTVVPFALALGALVVALISQYGFGKHPCDLCITQRIPYGVVMVAACAAFFTHKRHNLHMLFWLVIIVAFLATAGVGVYHAMVELGWIEGPDSCSAKAAATTSLDAMKAQILGAPLVSCSNVSVSFLGVSMAGWNALYATICAAISAFLMNKQRKSSHA